MPNYGGEGFGQLEGLQDEDFKEAGKSSAPTVEGKQAFFFFKVEQSPRKTKRVLILMLSWTSPMSAMCSVSRLTAITSRIRLPRKSLR